MSKYADGTELASVRLAHLERGKTLHLSEKRIRRDMERASHVALLLETVALAWRVPVIELRAPTRRCARVAFARQVAMYMGHVTFGLNLSTIGKYFGRDRTTAAHACRIIEDLRDDRHFDQLLERLEVVLRTRRHRLADTEVNE